MSTATPSSTAQQQPPQQQQEEGMSIPAAHTEVIQEIKDYVSRSLRGETRNASRSARWRTVALLLCAVADGDIHQIEDIVAETEAVAAEEGGEDGAAQPIPFASAPYNVLHYAAIAPTPLSMQAVLFHEHTIERLAPVDPNATSYAVAKTTNTARTASSSTAKTTGEGSAAASLSLSADLTPLHLAVMSQSLPCTKMLIANGASVRATRKKFVTILQDVAAAKQPQLLQERDARNALLDVRKSPPTTTDTTTPSTATASGGGGGGGGQSTDDVAVATTSPTLMSSQEQQPKKQRKKKRSLVEFASLAVTASRVSKHKSGNDGSAPPPPPAASSSASAATASQALSSAHERRKYCLSNDSLFLIAVLLVGKGADPERARHISKSSPMRHVTPELGHWLELVRDEVKERIQTRADIGLGVLESGIGGASGAAGNNKKSESIDAERHPSSPMKTRSSNLKAITTNGGGGANDRFGRLYEDGAPTHKLFLRDFLLRRAMEQHEGRLEVLATNLAPSPSSGLPPISSSSTHYCHNQGSNRNKKKPKKNASAFRTQFEAVASPCGTIVVDGVFDEGHHDSGFNAKFTATLNSTAIVGDALMATDDDEDDAYDDYDATRGGSLFRWNQKKKKKKFEKVPLSTEELLQPPLRGDIRLGDFVVVSSMSDYVASRLPKAKVATLSEQARRARRELQDDGAQSDGDGRGKGGPPAPGRSATATPRTATRGGAYDEDDDSVADERRSMSNLSSKRGSRRQRRGFGGGGGGSRGGASTASSLLPPPTGPTSTSGGGGGGAGGRPRGGGDNEMLMKLFGRPTHHHHSSHHLHGGGGGSSGGGASGTLLPPVRHHSNKQQQKLLHGGAGGSQLMAPVSFDANNCNASSRGCSPPESVSDAATPSGAYFPSSQQHHNQSYYQNFYKNDQQGGAFRRPGANQLPERRVDDGGAASSRSRRGVGDEGVVVGKVAFIGVLPDPLRGATWRVLEQAAADAAAADADRDACHEADDDDLSDGCAAVDPGSFASSNENTTANHRRQQHHEKKLSQRSAITQQQHTAPSPSQSAGSMMVQYLGLLVEPAHASSDGTFFGDGVQYFPASQTHLPNAHAHAGAGAAAGAANTSAMMGLFVPAVDVAVLLSATDQRVAEHRLKRAAVIPHHVGAIPHSSATTSTAQRNKSSDKASSSAAAGSKAAKKQSRRSGGKMLDVAKDPSGEMRRLLCARKAAERASSFTPSPY